MMSDTNEREPIDPNNQAGVTTGIPHSGVHHDENPVDVYKATLGEAHAKGFLNPVPDTVDPEALRKNEYRGVPQTGTTEPSRRNLKVYAAGGLAFVVAATGFGVFKATQKPKRESNPAVATAPLAPVPTTEAEPKETGVEPTPELAEDAGLYTSVKRSNGEVIKVKHITDEDIKSGQAAYILKEVAALYMTTGDERLLEDFLYNPERVTAVESWRQIRLNNGVAESNERGGDMALKYDVSKMQVEVVSVNDGRFGEPEAKILLKNDQELYTESFVSKWAEFKFNSYNKIKWLPGTVKSQRYANFAKAGDVWLFTGFTDS